MTEITTSEPNFDYTATAAAILSALRSERESIGLLDEVAAAFGASTPAQRAYITFLATLSPNIELIEEGDHYHATLALLPDYDRKRIDSITQKLVDQLSAAKKPTRIDALHRAGDSTLPVDTLKQVARVSKRLADL